MANFIKKSGPRSSDWNYGGGKWKLSRSKIDLFMECPRCFFLDNKLGVSRPRGPAFTLNVAVDALLKKEFDIHRAKRTTHPLMEKYGVSAIPFDHEEIDKWRENFIGIQFFHESTGFTISGAIDDVWQNKKGELIIVDYKATAKEGKMDSLSDTKWENQYKRQMEIYQWLFRKKGFKVSDTGYFVYVNGKKDAKAFDGKLEFDVTLIPHTGKDNWIEKTLFEIKETLSSENIPSPDSTCEFCQYRKSALEIQSAFVKKQKISEKPKKDETINKKPKSKNIDEEKTGSLF